MKTILKVFLIVLVAILALKVLPLIFALGIGLLACVAAGLAVGLGAVGILLCLALAFVAALSPIWLPVLAVLGMIALCKRVGRAT